MTDRQIEFNSSEVHLLDDLSTAGVFDHKLNFVQKAKTGLDISINSFNEHTTVPQDGSQANFAQRIGSTLDVAGTELRKKEKLSKRLAKVAILVGTGLGWAVESTPTYEYIAALSSVTAQQLIANPHDNLGLVVTGATVGLIGGATTAVEQGATALFTSGSMKYFPKSLEFWNSTKKHEVDVNKKEQGDFATAYFISTSAAVIEQNARDPYRTFRQNKKMSLNMAAKVGAINTGLIGGFSVGLQIMDRVGWENASDTVESILKNPLPYFSIFAILKSTEYIREQRKFKKHNQTLPTD